MYVQLWIRTCNFEHIKIHCQLKPQETHNGPEVRFKKTDVVFYEKLIYPCLVLHLRKLAVECQKPILASY